MMTVLYIMVSLLFAAGPPAILISEIRRWRRISPKIVAPAWRTYFAIVAIAVVGLSEFLWVVSAVWAAIYGGESYNPVFQWIGVLGFFAAPAGLLVGLFGKGTLRWLACGLSIFVTFYWLALGLAISDI